MSDPQIPDPAALRARLMLSMDEMAKAVGVNRSTVWRWEHGAKPTMRHMRKLVKLATRTPPA